MILNRGTMHGPPVRNVEQLGGGGGGGGGGIQAVWGIGGEWISLGGIIR